MKIFTLTTWVLLVPLLVFATSDNNGKIKRTKSGVYQLIYPQQTIHLFFNYLPTNGLENMFAEAELSENEQYKIIYLFKQYVDQLPEAFINQYLDLEIFLLHIQNEMEFGFTFDDQVVVEIIKIREGMSFDNSVQTAFAHEVGHLVLEHPDHKMAAEGVISYLDKLHLAYYEEDKSALTSTFERGYVSRYASGDLLDEYNSIEEFAELFAFMTTRNNRLNVLHYLENDRGSILNVKMDRLGSFIDKQLPSLNMDFLFDYSAEEATIRQTFNGMDGELLLSSHELKSSETFDFSATKEELREELLLANSIPEYDQEESIHNPTEEQDQQDWSVYEYSQESEEYAQQVPSDNSKSKKSKKKKRKKGANWLLVGTAVYVALQLMK